MARDGGNIYQTARKAAGLTQEAAAERLAVSDTSIRAYESGERLPGDDIVARMCAVYNVQYLGLQHLQLKTALLPDCVQEAVERLLHTVPPTQLHAYAPAPGMASVREKVAAYLTDTFGEAYRAQDIYMTDGASSALAILTRAHGSGG